MPEELFWFFKSITETMKYKLCIQVPFLRVFIVMDSEVKFTNDNFLNSSLINLNSKVTYLHFICCLKGEISLIHKLLWQDEFESRKSRENIFDRSLLLLTSGRTSNSMSPRFIITITSEMITSLVFTSILVNSLKCDGVHFATFTICT